MTLAHGLKGTAASAMGMRRVSSFVAVIALLLLLPGLLQAGTGMIKGKVFDRDTKEGLPSANIMIRGTRIGTTADLNGNFSIPNAPSGELTLVVTYIGYGSVSVPLTVQENVVVKRDFALRAEAIKGKEYIITAQAQGQVQAINQQLAETRISSVVSEAKIQELPDFNAAAAISRLPGVSSLESSGEANKIVIRGLAPQYNMVSVEGVKLASTGSSQMGVSALGNTSGSINNDRSVDLSMVSPYMIKSISVYKALTPDLDANAIGGTVNMELREAPTELHYDLLWQQGYTAKTKNSANYRGVASLSRRFFSDKLGIYVLGNVEQYDRDADNMNASYYTTSTKLNASGEYRPVKVRNVQLLRHIETRQRFGGNLILDYKLPFGSLKSVNMFTRLSSDYQDNTTILNYFDKQLNFNYREGLNKTDLTVNSLEWKNDFHWIQTGLKFANTSSKNNLPQSPFIELKTGPVTTGPVTDDTVPDSLKKLWAYPGASQVYLDNINLFSSLYKENNTTVTPYINFPFRFGSSLTGFLKIGGTYRHQKNSNDQKTPYASIRSSGTFQTAMVNALSDRFDIAVDPSTAKFAASNFTGPSDLTRIFLDNQFGQIYWACDPSLLTAMARYLAATPEWRGKATGGADQTGGWYNGMFQNLANTYDYSEDYYASYLMSEINFQNLMVTGGVRYENSESKFTAYNMFDMRNPDSQNCDTVTARPKSEYWLPMVQAKYSPLRWVDLRYAYTQTLARPDYHQMSPKVTYDSPRMNIRAGNPELKPARAYNHDVTLTFHSNKLGLLSLGGFYKTINGFTYYTTYTLHKTAATKSIKTINDFDIMGTKPADGATLYTYINSNEAAYVKGLELDFQTRLWYLPWQLSGIVLGVNYTKIESEATYPLRDNVTNYTTRPPVTTTYDSTRVGRLIYQPNDLVNAYVGYDFKGFSARVSFLFQGNSVSYVGAFKEQDGYTRDYFRIDASVRQALPIHGMEIFLDFNNLNDEQNSSAQRSIDGFTNVKNYGMTANFGIRYR
ncbi:MAG TPA: carboxypeptidase-like regulatory domain-containing protein [bacterium]|nr:carboxypeptidase-like regulatory domain-containing protein [bacterium]HPR88873.1 carboxypeptidase-like regulatory domain-containing protein [bacterium]